MQTAINTVSMLWELGQPSPSSCWRIDVPLFNILKTSWDSLTMGGGQFTPGQFTPGQYTPGRFTPGQFTPGRFTPGQFTPGQFTPGLISLNEASSFGK